MSYIQILSYFRFPVFKLSAFGIFALNPKFTELPPTLTETQFSADFSKSIFFSSIDRLYVKNICPSSEFDSLSFSTSLRVWSPFSIFSMFEIFLLHMGYNWFHSYGISNILCWHSRLKVERIKTITNCFKYGFALEYVRIISYLCTSITA
jgi:hypothetical protein